MEPLADARNNFIFEGLLFNRIGKIVKKETAMQGTESALLQKENP